MKYLQLLLTFILFSLTYVPTSVQAISRRVTDIPVPSRGVADPDGILSELHRNTLEERIEKLDTTIVVGDKGDKVEVQMAIAIVERMDIADYEAMTGYEVDEEEVAEQFARSLHDAWGVGHNTDKGGTGVLIFLSVYDRVIFISRGGALDRILNNVRIDATISDMTALMRQAKYTDGLLLAVEELAKYIEKGEPTWKESFWNLFQVHNFFILAWLGAFVNGIWKSQRQRQEQIAYVQAASQLSEIDRAQAEALQGQYQATSCPICLESFKSSTVGSDDQPIKLLRCGHVFDETCWSEWVSNGHGNVTKCPICKMDIGQSSSSATELVRPADTAGTQATMRVHEETAAPDETQTNTFNAEDEMGRAETLDEQQQRLRERVLRRYQQERAFRLMRLGARFPTLFSNAQIQNWSSPTYRGSLVQDPAFRQRDPRVLRPENNGNRVGGHSRPVSFGGGRSSGGRSGRF